MTESRVAERTATQGDRDDDDDVASSEDEGSRDGGYLKSGNGGASKRRIYSPKYTETCRGRGQENHDARGRGVSNILRAYKGQRTFSGLYDEDLEAIAENYSETADSCDATDYEKRKAMFSMLHGSAWTLINRKGKGCKEFDEGMELLRSWYISDDKQGRLLTEWHGMSLTRTMEE